MWMGKNGGKRSKKTLSPEVFQLLKEIARIFKFLRKAAGYRNSDMFSYVHEINRSQYGRYEVGKVDMKVGSLVSTFALFGLSVEDIFNPDFLAIGKSKNGVDELSEKYWIILRNRVRNQVGREMRYVLTDQVIDRIVLILAYCIVPRSRREILKHLGLTNTSPNFKRNAGMAIEQKWIAMTIPDKPNSRNQQYLTTPAGRSVLGAASKSG